MSIQLVDKEWMASTNGYVREIHRRLEVGLPYADMMRTLMERFEKTTPLLAKQIQEDPLWERFQMHYNTPDRDRRKTYGMACSDFFEQALLATLFAWGYWEMLEDDKRITVNGVAPGVFIVALDEGELVTKSLVVNGSWDVFDKIAELEKQLQI